MSLYILYLTLVWYLAYPVYRQIYPTVLSRYSYVSSNLSFSLPILLPWVIISTFSDIIYALPFQIIKDFLSNPLGEIIYSLIFLFGIALFGPVLIQKSWGCKPLEKGIIRSHIEAVCERAKCEYADIVYWPIFEGKLITAGVMGLIKKFRYILITDALIKFLTPDEIESVIAHEVGHVKKKHILFYLLFFIGYLILSISTFNLINYGIIFLSPLYNPNHIITFVSILMLILYFRYIFGYFMRNFEREADIFVFTLFDSGIPLISTLEKIAIFSGQSPDKPNWHHFSITERIDYIKKCEIDKIWILKHTQKIKKSVSIFLIGMAIIGIIGYQFNFGDAGKNLNNKLFEKILLKQLEITPNKAELYAFLGDIYYSKKLYEKTIWAYKRSLVLQPENAHVLNNLAWLFVTCEDKKFTNPKEALNLAKKAYEIEKAPHILDTLAESYFLNGEYGKAIFFEKEALKLAKVNLSYYEDQLKKFIKKQGE
ncbi:MAG: M48 family metalloprotease [Desulfobacterales bacterium]|nr:M48 family metalloprotease [Desulfobacterales bacterium]